MKHKSLIKTLLLLFPLFLVGCNEEHFHDVPQEIEESYNLDQNGFYILDDKYINDNRGDFNNVYIPAFADGQPLATSMKLFVAGKEAPVYNVKTNFSQTWNGNTQTRMNNAVCTIGIKNEIEVIVQTNFNIKNEVTIRPLAKEVSCEIKESLRFIKFRIKSSGQYTVEFRNDRTLHLFVNDFDKMNFDYIGKNYMVFEPGVHTHQNDSRINSSNEVVLNSNQTVYIHPSAVVHAKFIASKKSNIKIFGCGYIDGQNFIRNQLTGEATVPIEFNFCNNITLEDIAIIDPAAWVFNICWCRDSKIKNCKVISSRSNGDGISIQSCTNIEVSDCFIRSWDDSLVVKNYKDWRNGNLGYTDTIKFHDCLIWTDLAQSMEIGYETVGEHMENISFENITVLHNFHKPIFSIHNGNQARIKNVSYKNIIVEDASMGKGDGNNVLLQFENCYSSTWSDQYGSYPIGDIDGVTMENITVLSGIQNPRLEISGFEEFRSGFAKKISYVKNVSISNFKLYGRSITLNDINVSLAENIMVN